MNQVTPIILTFNESANIVRTLESVKWANQILVVDSGSDDGTLELLSRYPYVRVIHREFDSFAGQWNFALPYATTEWVLVMDADYVVTAALADEIVAIQPRDDVSGYRVRFRYLVNGRRLRGTLYPDRIVLFRRSRGSFVDEGHRQRLSLNGKVAQLAGQIDHDDRKPLSRWLASQLDYAETEATHLLTLEPDNISWPDRLRRWIWPAAPATLFYTLILKRCILDGWPGWFYALQRTYAEVLLSLVLVDRRLRRDSRSDAKSEKSTSCKDQVQDCQHVGVRRN